MLNADGGQNLRVFVTSCCSSEDDLHAYLQNTWFKDVGKSYEWKVLMGADGKQNQVSPKLYFV